jgi:hypothetical protein
MKELFDWLSTLNSSLLSIIAVIAALIMFLIPFMDQITSIFWIIVSNKKAEIVDFSWRLIPDLNIGERAEKKFYLLKTEHPIIYEGMIILINWQVIGAYRIDIKPLGKNLKGNAAKVVLSSEKCHYTLIAHTLKGKLKKELTIDSIKILKLKTFNISKELLYGQSNHILKTKELVNNNYNSFEKFTYLFFRKLTYLSERVYFKRNSLHMNVKRLYFNTTLKEDKSKLRNTLTHSLKNKHFIFNPKAYNEAINDFEKNNTII